MVRADLCPCGVHEDVGYHDFVDCANCPPVCVAHAMEPPHECRIGQNGNYGEIDNCPGFKPKGPGE